MSEQTGTNQFYHLGSAAMSISAAFTLVVLWTTDAPTLAKALPTALAWISAIMVAWGEIR